MTRLVIAREERYLERKFGDDYRNRYKKETDCRKGYVVDDCKNAPKKSGKLKFTFGW